jgi:predicted class III extradiol MEMO1 family dioxygenase
MSNMIKTGSKVNYSENTKWGLGVVLERSERKATVKFEGVEEPQSVFIKYLTEFGAAAKVEKAAPVPKKASGAKKARVREPKTDHVVPLVRKDGKDSHSIVAGADLSHYKLHKEAKTPSGRPAFDIGDKVASMLRGKSVDEVIAITANELTRVSGERVTQTSLKEKYAKLNPGQIRMNCGNRLRGVYKAEAGA